MGRLTILETRGSGRGVNVASLNRQSYVGEKGENACRGWPVIEHVKQKEVNIVLPHTRKLLVFLGSNKAHRTPTALEARHRKRSIRAETWRGTAWTQQIRQR